MQTNTLTADFLRLRTAWAATPAGRGGIAALAGFDFQLALALLELVRQQQDEQCESASSGDRLFIEALSDIVAQDGGNIIISQAKRTLASNALSNALDELWAIDCVARKIAPESAHRFIYRVAAARPQLRDWGASRDRWMPENSEPVELAAFKAKVRCEYVPDPRLETARLLVLKFNDTSPLDTVDNFIGKLVEAANNGSFDSAIRQINILLGALRQAAINRKQSFRLWGSTDRPPDEVQQADNERSAIRIGERLTLLDLREGRLANRALYENIHTACENWLSKTSDTEGKIPVFWIEGRSGTGKSAALLHLCSRLHANDQSRVIIWLGDRSNLVGDAIHWVAPFLREGRQVMIAIDDPFTAERQVFEIAVRRARDEWDQVRTAEIEAERPLAFPPVIVCCGPAEQRQDAESACGSDIDVEPHELPRETTADLDALAVWYHKRTGRNAPELRGDILLVQRFFEWDKGEINDFARRFRKRLERFDDHRSEKVVFQTISKILALGRLYAEYPADEIFRARDADPVLERAFVQLAEEESHFSFESNSNAQTGIRLTHPHLANAIYRAWFGLPADRGYRKLHLRDGLRAAFKRNDLPPSQRLGPFWAIAKMAGEQFRSEDGETTGLRERIDLIREELITLFPELFHDLVAQTASPLTDLPVWTDLAVSFNLNLAPNPLIVIAYEVGQAMLPGPGLRLACHKLLQHRDQVLADFDQTEVVAGALERLCNWGDKNERPWHDWIPVALDFIKRAGATRIEPSLDRVLSKFPTWPAVGQLASELALTLDKQPALRDILLNWLDRTPTWFPSWAHVLGDIHKKTGRCGRFDALALKFLSENPNHGSWSFFWQYLWKDGVVDRANLEQRALAWIGVGMGQIAIFPTADSSNVGGFDRIWEDLWHYYRANTYDLDRLAARALRWLGDVDPNRAGWSYVWINLRQDAKDDSERWVELTGLADDWLAVVDPKHSGWKYVWEKVWEEGKNDRKRRAKLTKLADNWLAVGDPNHGGWTFVWEKLWSEARKDRERREKLTGLADNWLAVVDVNHGSWAFPWKELWSEAKGAGERQAKLKGLGDNWLVVVGPNHGSWQFVWKELWSEADNDRGHRANLSTLADKWLADVDPNHGGWQFVWKELWSEAKKDGKRQVKVTGLADNWIAAVNPNHGSWAFVWTELLSEAKDGERREKLRGQADNWLAAVDRNHDGWRFVWEKLWHEARGDGELQAKLKGRADNWLAVVDANHGGWQHVWTDLWQDAKHGSERRRTLTGFACIWLGAVGPNYRGWKYVWGELWSEAKDDGESRAKLMGLANEWFAVVDPNHGSWTFVWKEIWSEAKNDSGRRAKLTGLADDWLVVVDPNHGSWAFVWEELLSEAKNDCERRAKLIGQADNWLIVVEPNHGSWQFVWKKLWDEAKNDSQRRAKLIGLGDNWLDVVDPSHGSWTFVWSDLWKVAANVPMRRSELTNRAHKWMTRVGHSRRRSWLEQMLRERLS